MADDKKKGIEKYVAKFKKALGRTSSSAGTNKRQSVVGTSSSSSPAAATTSKATSSTAHKNDTAAKKEEILRKANVDPNVIEIGAAAERVEKKIRLRVHRTCHNCQSEFGKERVCPKCQHKRCKDCTRSPPKKNKGVKKASAAATTTGAAATPSTNSVGIKTNSKGQITKPARTGGQDLVMKKPTQRVRRTCHQCQTLFTNGNKECSNCKHVRCTDCPRDPAKAKKYPYGYPNDEPGTDESKNFKECHECQNVFRNGEAECTKCGHAKCDQCPRTAPRKVRDYHDPDVVRSVEEKLAKLGLGGPPAVTA